MNNGAANTRGSRHFPGVRKGVKPPINSCMKHFCERLRRPSLVPSQPETDYTSTPELERHFERPHCDFFRLTTAVVYYHITLDPVRLTPHLETIQQRSDWHLPVA